LKTHNRTTRELQKKKTEMVAERGDQYDRPSQEGDRKQKLQPIQIQQAGKKLTRKKIKNG
jgi:hypothetical protein